ncbi:MAG: hypothetical protein K6F54_03895 [Lachnospiraceae bacterium]|nr:hypothetical protein [Lachnospiraceae bacterium]
MKGAVAQILPARQANPARVLLQAPACNHSYEWVETKQATENNNGECAYKCKLCGEVLYRVPTNAMGVFVQNTINNIVKAPQGGTVVIDTDRWYSFPKSVFDALAARPDLTLTVNYLSEGFKGDPMTFTIPAGRMFRNFPMRKDMPVLHSLVEYSERLQDKT